ncbi:hypothetical protein GCM10027294_45350 [Marinactinospora endophytica]
MKVTEAVVIAVANVVHVCAGLRADAAVGHAPLAQAVVAFDDVDAQALPVRRELLAVS